MYGKKIKEWRKNSNLTQMEIAKKTNIPQNTISWIESEKGIPSIEHCVILADYYGITVDELIGHEVKKNW